MWDLTQIPREEDTQAAEIQSDPQCVQTVVLLPSHQKGLEQPATQRSGQRHPRHICVNSAQVIPKPQLSPCQTSCAVARDTPDTLVSTVPK